MDGIYFEMREKDGRYHCDVNDELIRKWIDVPVTHKLRWLEEANRFLADLVDKSSERWQSPAYRARLEIV